MALEAETVGAGSEPLPMSGARVWARGLAAVGRPRRPARVLAVGAAIAGGIGIAGTIAASAGAPASAALLGLYAVAMAASVVAAVAAALLAEFAPVTRLFAEHSDALLIVAGDGVVLKANPAFRRLFGAGKFALDRVEADCAKGQHKGSAVVCGSRCRCQAVIRRLPISTSRSSRGPGRPVCACGGSARAIAVPAI